jgi:hypothetical protein
MNFELFQDPNDAQAEAWRMLNTALAHLALAYDVPMDSLNEVAGAAVETAIVQISIDEAA